MYADLPQAAVAVLYGFGLFVTIVQAIRIKTIAALATYTESKPIIEWSIVEINMGVIVACVPAFSPLLKSFGKKLSYNSRSRSGAYGKTAGSKGASATRDDRRQVGNGSRVPASRSRILRSFRADDEVELCDAKDGWVSHPRGWNTSNVQSAPASTHARDVTNEAESDRLSGASSAEGERHITVVHEYTVQHGDSN